MWSDVWRLQHGPAWSSMVQLFNRNLMKSVNFNNKFATDFATQFAQKMTTGRDWTTGCGVRAASLSTAAAPEATVTCQRKQHLSFGFSGCFIRFTHRFVPSTCLMSSSVLIFFSSTWSEGRSQS